MQDVSATLRILGRKTAGAGDPEECTLSEILDFIAPRRATSSIAERRRGHASRPGRRDNSSRRRVPAQIPFGRPPYSAYHSSARSRRSQRVERLPIAHGLGAMPTLIQSRLICKIAEGGYNVNDEVIINPNQQDVAGQGDRGHNIVPDATNVNVRYGDQPGTFQIFNKTSGTAFTITNANWRLIVRAWARSSHRSTVPIPVSQDMANVA
jgi:hypothetical protein